MRFLNSAVDRVSCDSYLVRYNLRQYIKVTIENLGVTDINHNDINSLYQIILVSCTSLMVGYLFDTGVLYIAVFSSELCCPVVFLS